MASSWVQIIIEFATVLYLTTFITNIIWFNQVCDVTWHWQTTNEGWWWTDRREGWIIDYRTRAINNRGLYSGKTFWPLVCGYYSREVTIQEKLFCTAMSTTLFHRNFYKNFQKTLGFLSLDYQDESGGLNLSCFDIMYHLDCCL